MTRRLRKISPIQSVAERDMDLLLLEELHASPTFRTWIVEKLFGAGTRLRKFEGAWHSISDAKLGETDLLFCFQSFDGDVWAALIENKISALTQYRQAARYRKRGRKGREDGSWDRYKTCLIAPKAYFETLKPSETFDVYITYEDLAEWFQSQGPADRGSYKAKFIKEAIEQNRRGYQITPDERISKFWRSYWQLCSSEFPQLAMKEPGPKPAGGTWPLFQPPNFDKRVQIIHKTEQGFVDLSFSGANAGDLKMIYRPRLDNETMIEQTGKSAVVRVAVPKIDMFAKFETEADNVYVALQAARKLYDLYCGHMPQ